ncbi:hypothetical protein HXX76_001916 [Chlamydomonas incerta]|uniref:Peptidase S8/S53 domain-containing protein n=1 Tax=Chlamydomonas incerta TaxID=51695 RepID=A0A835WA25_CHLIN|nr:hypothetical protein HXX76_001916 [Chlamydomonas incerta]|eukprot:KAG2443564.1 hypothetical protein HXX76_001916 [Chlamydomonas incerta]
MSSWWRPGVALGLVLALAAATGASADRFALDISPATTRPALEAAVKDLGGSVIYFHSAAGIAVIDAPAGSVSAGGLSSVGVAAAFPDFRVTLPKIDPTTAPSTTPPPKAPIPKQTATKLQFLSAPISQAPADPLWPQQWAPRSLHAEGAWAAGVTGKCVRVAVVDTGMWWDHPDLAGRVDADFAKSFVAGKQPYEDNWAEGYWHASHVAGIVAASLNGYGVVGVAPEATIIPVKVLDNGSGWFSDVMAGIVYAATSVEKGGAGADIINLSLGGSTRMSDPGSGHEWGLFLTKVMNYATAQGVFVAAAAGNDGLDLDRLANIFFTPCENGNTVCVSSAGPRHICSACECAPVTGAIAFPSIYTCPCTTSPPWPLAMTQQPASYTNYGRSAIWVAGPGGDNSARWETPQWPCWRHDRVLGVGSPNPEGYKTLPRFVHFTGTSMATPAVAGVAALVIHNKAKRQAVDLCAPRAAGRPRNPMTPGQVKTALAQGAVVPGGAGASDYYGHGIVDVGTTLGYPQPPWAD